MSSPWSNQVVSLIILTEETGGFSGMFGYSPAPGAGNLIFSLSAAAGTDEYGNTYPQGLSVGASADPQISLMPLTGGAAQIQFPMAAPVLEAPGALTAVEFGGAALLNINGPAVASAASSVQLSLWSDPGDGSGSSMEFYVNPDEFTSSNIASMTGDGFKFRTPVNLNSLPSPPSTPAAGCYLYYYAGTLYALGSSGVPVALATT